MSRWHRHSLSGRLVILFVVMAFLLVLLVGGSIGSVFKAHFKQSVRPHLINYLNYVQNDIGIPPDIAKAESIAARLPIEIQISGPGRDWSSIQPPIDLDRVEFHHNFRQQGVNYAFGELGDREYLVATNSDYTIAFSVPHAREKAGWRLVIPVVLLLVILVLLYLATHRLIAPVKILKRGIERIGSGDLSHRIELKCKDELGVLADSINTMADDIEQMLEAKRQLLLAISHELRSPLTRAKVAVALLGDEGQCGEIECDLNEMEKLIEELLETERLTTTHRVLNLGRFSANEMVAELIESHFAEAGIEIALGAHLPELELDRARIKLLLKNLLENGVRHTPADRPTPRLSVECKDEQIEMVVEDFGNGIEAQHIPYLTDPFYRADPSRRRETGGYGLGLYLCAVIAEAHRGSLNIESSPGEGTRVTVMLPLRAVQSAPQAE